MTDAVILPGDTSSCLVFRPRSSDSTTTILDHSYILTDEDDHNPDG